MPSAIAIKLRIFTYDPKLENADSVGEELWLYFHPSGTCYTNRSIKRLWCVQATHSYGIRWGLGFRDDDVMMSRLCFCLPL